MNISQIMTRNVEFIPPSASLDEAASKMRELDCGFLPIARSSSDKIEGVITDRDIVVRAIAEGMNPRETKVEQIKSDGVLYCFEDDSIEDAAQSMHDQQVYRLVVLNNVDEKRLAGVVSLGDITRGSHENDDEIAGYAMEGMKRDTH